MSRETFEDWIFKSMGGLAIFVCAISTFPQVYKMFKTKKTNDVSKWSLLSLFTGTLLFSIYAFYFGLWEIFIPNFVTLLMIFLQILLKWCYDNNKFDTLDEHILNQVKVESPSLTDILDNPDEIYHNSKSNLSYNYQRNPNEDFKAY